MPRVLTPGEIRLLLAQLAELYHTMVLVAACLGLRASEIMGLQWQDFNWEDLTVLIRRGVVNGRSGDTKTEASQKSLPIDPRLARSMQELWKRTLHQGPQDWVFANKAGRPRGQQNILHRHLRPAALRAGIGKIGWHTFRHSYSTMLRGAGTDISPLAHQVDGISVRQFPPSCVLIDEMKKASEVELGFRRQHKRPQPFLDRNRFNLLQRPVTPTRENPAFQCRRMRLLC